MFKILFYTNSIFLFGGVQRVLAVIAKELALSHDVTILTLEPQKQENRSMYGLDASTVKIDFLEYSTTGCIERFFCKTTSALYKKVLPKTRLTADIYAHSFFYPNHRKQLAEYINQGGFDIVIGVHIFLSLHIAAIANDIKAKTIGWMHNSYEAMFEKDNPYMPAILHDFCRHQLKKLDNFIVLSDSDKRLFMERMQLAATRIYNPLTIDVNGQADYTVHHFLSIGRMENGHKGFDILINAFAEFAKTNADWRLDIVGDGPLKAELQKQIDDLDMHDRITIHPFTNHVEQYYTSTSAYVLASRWEGFGLVLLEAAAHGQNIIASDLPVTRELLGDQPFASLFPVEDMASLSTLMGEKAEEDLRQSGDDARRYCVNFHVKSIIQEWESLLYKTLKICN